MKRDQMKTMTIRFNQEEYKVVASKAKEAGLSLKEFVRCATINADGVKVENTVLYEDYVTILQDMQSELIILAELASDDYRKQIFDMAKMIRDITREFMLLVEEDTQDIKPYLPRRKV